VEGTSAGPLGIIALAWGWSVGSGAGPSKGGIWVWARPGLAPIPSPRQLKLSAMAIGRRDEAWEIRIVLRQVARRQVKSGSETVTNISIFVGNSAKTGSSAKYFVKALNSWCGFASLRANSTQVKPRKNCQLHPKFAYNYGEFVVENNC
jgi:hypothetical protein